LSHRINSFSKSGETDLDHLYETVLEKNRAVITELENLITAIALAKLNLLSPVILDNIDVGDICNEHLTKVSVADVLAIPDTAHASAACLSREAVR